MDRGHKASQLLLQIAQSKVSLIIPLNGTSNYEKFLLRTDELQKKNFVRKNPNFCTEYLFIYLRSPYVGNFALWPCLLYTETAYILMSRSK